MTATFAIAQRPGRAGSTPKAASAPTTVSSPKISVATQPSRDTRAAGVLPPADIRHQDVCQEGDRPNDKGSEKHGDPRRAGEGRTVRGGQHPGGPELGEARAHLERRFIHDAVRRTGGPLELLPLLFLPEVREELKRDDESFDEQSFQANSDAYMAEMQKRIEGDRQEAATAPKSLIGEMFAKNIRRENEQFQKFFDELPQRQQDQLIYLFIQARNYRSLSNRLVESKMGLSPEEASAIRGEIEEIREQTMNETRDRFRRIFDKGGGRDEFEKMVRENQRKMDARIEKKLSEEQRAKFLELRGKTSAEAPDWLVRGIDFPPPRSKEMSQRKP